MNAGGLNLLDPSSLEGVEQSNIMDLDAKFDAEPVQNPKKLKAKKYKGLMEWILERDGHEFLVDVDRAFIREVHNLAGVREQFICEVGGGLNKETMSERRF